MKKYILITFLIVLSSCQSKIEPIVVTKSKKIADFPKVNDNQEYVGAYIGILPCADCEGMETQITINENNTYTKSVHYLGKGTKLFEQKGSFSWNTLGNIIQLDNVESAPNHYLVSEGKLIQLDMEGSIIEGTLAKEYELSKQPKIERTIESSVKMEDKVNLNNKLESSASVEKVNSADGKHTLAETRWKLITLNGNTVSHKGKKPSNLKMNSSDGRFSAYAGCNTMFGSYAMPSANTISFSEIGATQMACPNMATENEFALVLDATVKYVLKNETLTFYGSGKSPIATFVALK